MSDEPVSGVMEVLQARIFLDELRENPDPKKMDIIRMALLSFAVDNGANIPGLAHLAVEGTGSDVLLKYEQLLDNRERYLFGD